MLLAILPAGMRANFNINAVSLNIAVPLNIALIILQLTATAGVIQLGVLLKYYLRQYTAEASAGVSIAH